MSEHVQKEYGENKYIRKDTIDIIEKRILPHMKTFDRKNVGFSEAVHKLAVEYAKKHSLFN